MGDFIGFTELFNISGSGISSLVVERIYRSVVSSDGLRWPTTSTRSTIGTGSTMEK